MLKETKEEFQASQEEFKSKGKSLTEKLEAKQSENKDLLWKMDQMKREFEAECDSLKGVSQKAHRDMEIYSSTIKHDLETEYGKRLTDKENTILQLRTRLEEERNEKLIKEEQLKRDISDAKRLIDSLTEKNEELEKERASYQGKLEGQKKESEKIVGEQKVRIQILSDELD